MYHRLYGNRPPGQRLNAYEYTMSSFTSPLYRNEREKLLSVNQILCW